MLVVCTLDPYDARIGTTDLDMPALGLDGAQRFTAVDELGGAALDWSQFNYVELGPHRGVAHILRLGET